MLIYNNKNPKLSKCFTDHQSDVVECLNKFEEYLKALFSGASLDQLKSMKVAIDNCEHAADEELRHVVDLLSDFFLPTTRSNLIAIVQSTDSVANISQSIARRITIEKAHLPECVHSDILEIVKISKVQLDILYRSVDLLLNNYKKIFKDRKILDDIRAEESKIDSIEQMLYERIFDLDLPLYEKIYYRDFIAHICNISDVIEDIADKIQIMLVERES